MRRWMGLCLDGLPFVGIPLFVAVAFLVSTQAVFSLPFFALAIGIAWFFRDPDRRAPTDAKVIVSPADGKVVAVQRVPYPRLLAGEATRVSIFMSVFNVHVNRIPFGGTVRAVHHNEGKYFAAFVEKASLQNEQTTVVLDTDRGVPIMFVQIAGWIARRIVCRLYPGERVERGERYGLIRFGSRCDVYFPDAIEVKVRPGDIVKGGETALGVFR